MVTGRQVDTADSWIEAWDKVFELYVPMMKAKGLTDVWCMAVEPVPHYVRDSTSGGNFRIMLKRKVGNDAA
jgi:hypothetical protein